MYSSLVTQKNKKIINCLIINLPQVHYTPTSMATQDAKPAIVEPARDSEQFGIDERSRSDA
ncbi:hypothetical protein [Haliscomenobacter hydrossis]|uniref:Uncharacterized protein n=1 Tax=Haliscomenobacter hydrossis (strain ATCC 27775 / DSM 1100 / LMG 10767 / O) TaxID=760192 RepID=F4KPT0_HALH1|nr:hypothetical protein [Haliscomenobacter hydrossis]AEE52180.1 hypothetical protein Halhy_4336 [Haliscomenobacter hydrossis DSM 1100]